MGHPTVINIITRLSLPLLTAALLLGTTSASQAVQVYKSVGAYGEVKYSQYPPQNSKNYEVIEFRSDGRQNDSGQMAGKTNSNQTVAPDPEAQRIAELEARIKEQDANANAQRCQSLRNNLTNLNVGGRIYEMDDNGNRRYLDGREIELKRERVQQAINQYCTGA